MKLSIALATFNGERFIREQLDSIIGQTYSDYELIICDDCSSDSTWKILEDYSQMDTRIIVFKNECTLGFKKNFEKAISLCTGDYIALCDQDDIWCNNHLEVLLNNLNGGTASFGNAAIMDDNELKSGELLSDRDRYFVDGQNEDKLTRILFYGNPFQGTSSLYTKDIFKYALPIPEGVEYHDAWFASVACCLNGLNYSYDVVTNYRLYGNNTSGSHSWNLWKQIIDSFKRTGWKTDRIVFSEELLKRIPSISDSMRKIILDAKSFHTNRVGGKRIQTILTTIKNYKKIYSTHTYRHIVSRCINILING